MFESLAAGPASLTAVVLVGGLGTRLRPVTGQPKVLAPVGGHPFITYVLDQLVTAGVARAVLCTGYLAEQVRCALGDSYGQLKLSYSVETEAMGTAGAVRYALPLLEGADTLLVLNGDSWCDMDPAVFLAWHRARRAQASIWLTTVADAGRFGCVEFDSDGHLLGFTEKQEDAGRGWVNSGIYLLSRRFVEEIPAGRAVSIEREIFPRWVRRGLFACSLGGDFIDIGTPESYAAATEFFTRGKMAASDGLDGGAAQAHRRGYVILDRDGTINTERRYLSEVAHLELLPGAADGLRRMRRMGFGLVVVTNQSAIGRGYFEYERLEQIHAWLVRLLAERGVKLDGIYICPHRLDQGCRCRKPLTGLVEAAAMQLGFDPRAAWVIGDKECDIELGRRVGAATILVATGYGRQTLAESAVRADYAVEDLTEAAHVIEWLTLRMRSVTAQAN